MPKMWCHRARGAGDSGIVDPFRESLRSQRSWLERRCLKQAFVFEAMARRRPEIQLDIYHFWRNLRLTRIRHQHDRLAVWADQECVDVARSLVGQSDKAYA